MRAADRVALIVVQLGLTLLGVALVCALGALAGMITWDPWRTEPLAFLVLTLIEVELAGRTVRGFKGGYRGPSHAKPPTPDQIPAHPDSWWDRE